MSRKENRGTSYIPRTELVYQYIAERLLDGTLQSGDRLNRREMAAALGISVSPVGEAFLRLENEGILETIPRKSTTIRVLDKEAIRDQIIIRVAIECQGARLYCGGPVMKEYDRLYREAEILNDQLSRETIDMEIIQNDIRFHRSLLELAGSPSLLRYYDQVMQTSLLLSTRLFFIQRFPRATRPSVSHTELLKKLTTEDSDKAERAIRLAIEDRTFIPLGVLPFGGAVKIRIAV